MKKNNLVVAVIIVAVAVALIAAICTLTNKKVGD